MKEENKILFVGGTWDLNGGKPSGLVNKFTKEISNADVFNGGNYNDLDKIIDSCLKYEIVFWWPYIPNDLPRLRNVKEVNYKLMLVASKGNFDKKYGLFDIVQKMFALKSNLLVEFSKSGDLFNMTVLDPLGNIWYDGTSIQDCAKNVMNRLTYIKKLTRVSTVSSDITKNQLSWFFDTNDDGWVASQKYVNINLNQDFLDTIKSYVPKFTEAIFNTTDPTRYVGNASFRCQKGFPSFRDGKYIMVSRRNVNKKFIEIDDFVPTYVENEKIYYVGDNKPSVDTPIQLKLYEKFKNINYMIHAHCYIKDAKFTKKVLPCGAVEEADEIFDFVKDNYNNDFERDFYVINLIGHGSLMMSSDIDKLKNVEIVSRNFPEKMY